MRVIISIFGSFLLACGGLCSFAGTSEFSQIEVEEEFRSYLVEEPMLMEMGGAKIESLADGRILILAVGLTPIKGTGPSERIRCQTVARAKAQKELVAKLEGEQVEANSSLVERTESTVGDQKYSVEKRSELTEAIRISVRGIITSIPQVGTWTSSQGDMFYLAIGKMVEPTIERKRQGVDE